MQSCVYIEYMSGESTHPLGVTPQCLMVTFLHGEPATPKSLPPQQICLLILVDIYFLCFVKMN